MSKSKNENEQCCDNCGEPMNACHICGETIEDGQPYFAITATVETANGNTIEVDQAIELFKCHADDETIKQILAELGAFLKAMTEEEPEEEEKTPGPTAPWVN